jgi:peptidoglycan/LPS O-acetylase OafA/YrhL
VLPLALALIVMTMCVVGVAGAFWGHAARELATSRDNLRRRLPAFLAGDIVVALFAALALGRFDAPPRGAPTPVAVVFGAFRILVPLASSLVCTGGSNEGGSSGGYE